MNNNSFKLMKVFCIHLLSEKSELFEISHKLNTECHCNSNSSYYPIKACLPENLDTDSFGSGYLNENECHKLNNKLLENGAKPGEIVLINHWW